MTSYRTAKWPAPRVQSDAEKYIRQHPDREAIAKALVTLADEIGSADVLVQESCWLAAELFSGPPLGSGR